MSQSINPTPKPRDQWNEDEIFDGRPKTDEIEILFFVPGLPPVAITIPNTLRAMQRLIGGTITCFQTGISGTIGVCHDEGLLLGFPPCRFIEKTGALIFGAFFIAGDGVNMHSLTPEQSAETVRVLGPLLTLAQVHEALRREEETLKMIEEWNQNAD